MKQVKEVSVTDQLMLVYDFLKGMGYDVDNLTIENIFNIKRGMLDAIENAELKDPVI